MPLKITLFYNQFSEGWTETYYTQTSLTPSQWLDTNPPSSWYPFVNFRHAAVSLYGVRASLIGSPRTASTYLFTGANALSGGQGSPVSAEPSSVDAFVDIYGVSGHRRPIYFRGLNDADVALNQNGVSIPSGNFVNGVNGCVLIMGVKQLCIQYQVMPPNGGQKWSSITSVAPSATGANTSNLIAAPPTQVIVEGTTKLLFSGIPTDDLPGFPRSAVVINESITNNISTWTIPYRMRSSGPMPYIPAKMRATVVLFGYDQIKTSTFVKFADRKTGRPIGVSRGRRSPAVRAL